MSKIVSNLPSLLAFCIFMSLPSMLRTCLLSTVKHQHLGREFPPGTKVISLIAAKNFLKFKKAIRCAYPKFTTRDALTFSRDRLSMWFDNSSSISKFKFNVYFQIHVFGTMSVQLLFIVVYCAWRPTFDTFRDFSPPLGKTIRCRRRSGSRCKMQVTKRRRSGYNIAMSRGVIPS